MIIARRSPTRLASDTEDKKSSLVFARPFAERTFNSSPSRRFVDVSATAVFNQLTRRRLRVCVRRVWTSVSLSRSLAHVRHSFCFSSLFLPRSFSLCLSGPLPVALSKTPRLHLPLLFICDIITRFVTLLSKRRCHAWWLSEQSFRSLFLVRLREKNNAFVMLIITVQSSAWGIQKPRDLLFFVFPSLLRASLPISLYLFSFSLAFIPLFPVLQIERCSLSL